MRIGFCCMRYPNPEQHKINGTTVTALRKLPVHAARAKLQALAEGNADKVLSFVHSVRRYPESKRMVRVGSGIWPMLDLDEPFAQYDLDVAQVALARVGVVARAGDVRLSFHPDHFTRLGSSDTASAARAVSHLNHVGRQAELCGVTNVNIHVYGSAGAPVPQSIAAFKANFQYLDESIGSRLTVENDEFGVGTQPLLDADLPCPVVFDPHHHWVNTGTWPADELFAACRATWAADRHPKIHYSYPRVHGPLDSAGRPTHAGNRTAERAHSDSYPNKEFSQWILAMAHANGLDVMCEAKHKDVARDLLWGWASELGYV